MARYKVNGVEYPSVTEIIDQLDKSGALIPWAVKTAGEYLKQNYSSEMGQVELFELIEKSKKEFRNVADEAMSIGSEVHRACELYIKNGEDKSGSMREEVANCFIGFLEWEKENVESWVESEKVLFHQDRCYAGTVDAIAKMKDGQIYLWDFKTSKGFYSGYDLQISAYRHMRESLSGEHEITIHDGSTVTEIYSEMKIDGMGIARFDKTTGEFEVKDYSKSYEKKLESFNLLLDFFYSFKKRRLKNNPRVK